MSWARERLYASVFPHQGNFSNTRYFKVKKNLALIIVFRRKYLNEDDNKLIFMSKS